MPMKWHSKLWMKIRNIFAPDIMVGVSEHRQPVNRKERRAAASIARKNSRKQHRR